MRRLLLALLLFAPALAWGQGAVQQSGPVTPGHLPVWVQDHLIGDGGTAPFGNPLCVNDGPTTGAYHQLCLNANSGGGGLISYTAMNGAAVLPMNCSINGTIVANCLSGGGGGTLTPPINVTGPLTGAATADTGILNVVSSDLAPTANQIYQYLVCGGACGAFTVDSMRGVMNATNASTGFMEGVAGYTVNDNATTGATGVSAFGVCDIDNCSTWGVYSLVTDHKYQVASSGVGRKLFNTFAVNATSTSTGGAAVDIGGIFLVEPSLNAIEVDTPSDGLTGGPAAPFNTWSSALQVSNGASLYGIILGTANYTKTVSNPSQPLQFSLVDASNTYQDIRLTGDPFAGGTLNISGSTNWSLTIDGGGGNTGITLGPTSATALNNNQSKDIAWQYWDAAGAAQYFYAYAQSDTLTVGTSASSGFVAVPDLVVAAGGNSSGVTINATAASGTAVPSKYLIYNFFDGSGVAQDYAVGATGGGALQFTATVANPYLLTPNIQIAYATGSTAGLSIGATAASGANKSSKSLLWDYYDASGNAQTYSANVDPNQYFNLATSAGTGLAKVNIDGQIFVKTVPGVTCAGTPTASFATSNGVVTHC